MSDYLPLEIEAEIMKRLPIKPLIQFRSVCKAWKSLIDASDFIACYSGQQTTQLQLLIKYQHDRPHRLRYFSIVDDETFPNQKLSLDVPLLVSKLHDCRIMGCCHGLLGLYGYCDLEGHGDPELEIPMVVIWNLSLRKAVAVVVPNVMPTLENWEYITDQGFGVCRETNDVKIVKVAQPNRWPRGRESISCMVPNSQVEVFALSTGAWRSPLSSNLPGKSITYTLSKVVVDGILYWLVNDMLTINGKSSSFRLILSFDITSEEFRQVNLPDSLAQQEESNLSLQRLHGSLVVTESVGSDMAVWITEDSCLTKSFTKLLVINVNTPPSLFFSRGFRKTGEAIIDVGYYREASRSLVVYEPYSRHINHLGITGKKETLFMYPYMETLILLDQPENFKIYNWQL